MALLPIGTSVWSTPSIGRSVGNLGANNIGERWHEVHYREHGIRGRVRGDVSGPANDSCRPDRALRRHAEVSPERTSVPHVLAAQIAEGPIFLNGRSIVRGETTIV